MRVLSLREGTSNLLPCARWIFQSFEEHNGSKTKFVYILQRTRPIKYTYMRNNKNDQKYAEPRHLGYFNFDYDKTR